jgi:hypothetical protein
MPGLGIHGGRCTLGDLDYLFDDFTGDRLILVSTHAASGLYKCLKIHVSYSIPLLFNTPSGSVAYYA